MAEEKKVLCTMCGNIFYTRRRMTRTCSPRCRKRRERVIKGTALATWAMNTPPNPKASKLWR